MMLRTIFITLFFSFASLNFSQAQNRTYTLSEIHQFTIDGGSNARSWDADITTATGTLELNSNEPFLAESATIDIFRSLTISIPVSGIESGTRGLTRNLQGYLKGDDHPVITFSLTGVENFQPSESGALITANGVITAAGVSHETRLSVEASVNSDQSISFKGTQPLLMTSFEIDPPDRKSVV